MNTRKKGDGYVNVRDFVLGRIRDQATSDDPFVRMSGEQIADAVGLATQTVNFHMRELLRRGAVIRHKRCYYALPGLNSSPPKIRQPPEPLVSQEPPVEHCAKNQENKIRTPGMHEPYLFVGFIIKER